MNKNKYRLLKYMSQIKAMNEVLTNKTIIGENKEF